MRVKAPAKFEAISDDKKEDESKRKKKED